MSQTQIQTAYLARAHLPEADALQRTVERLGFDLLLDESFAPGSLAGYQPCLLAGEESGVEMFLRDAREAAAEFPAVAGALGERDAAITLRWGGDLGECACALALSAALAAGFDALVHDETDDVVCGVDQLVAEARAVLAELARGA